MSVGGVGGAGRFEAIEPLVSEALPGAETTASGAAATARSAPAASATRTTSEGAALLASFGRGGLVTASADGAPGTPPFDPAVQPALALGRASDKDAVRRMQAALNVWRGLHGYAPLAVDGGFGPGTKAALAEFQRAKGLGADGVCGPATWRALAAAATRPAPGPREAETFAAASAPGRTDAATRTAAAAWQGVPGTTSVTALAGNGGRPVAVHLPPGFDASKPAKVVTMFHGHYWNAGSELRSKGVLERVEALGKQDPQTIFVFPQSGRVPYSYWMKPPESFKALHDQALAEAARLAGAPSITVSLRIVDAHSGSGYTLQNAIRSGEFQADKVNLLDSSYNDWSQSVAYWAAANRDAHRPRVESWYTRHASQATNNAAIARIAPDVVTTHDVTATEGHNQVPGKYMGTR
jgi:peptidoglycan hydrolase-like protein with peptidoglycan-binding domain